MWGSSTLLHLLSLTRNDGNGLGFCYWQSVRVLPGFDALAPSFVTTLHTYEYRVLLDALERWKEFVRQRKIKQAEGMGGWLHRSLPLCHIGGVCCVRGEETMLTGIVLRAAGDVQ